MPDALTHCLFAKEVIEILPNSLKSIAKENLDYYLLGSSGPDACYYYGQIPWLHRPEKKAILALGNALHEDRINDFFGYVISAFNTFDESLKAYLLGYMTHYILDRTCHPFVFYRSGFSHEQQKQKIYMAYHKRYEVLMDNQLALMYLNKSIYDVGIFDFLKVQKLDTVAQFYQQTAHQLFDIQVAKKDIKHAFHDLSSAFKLTRDQHHYKYQLLKKMDPQNKSMLINSLYVPTRDAHFDVLNLKKDTWYHPCTNEAHQESMIELMAQAKSLASEWFLVLQDDVHNQTKTLLTIVQDRQFDTGLPKEESKMIYHQCLFEYENN